MISLIVGSNRPGSNTRKIAAQLEEFYAKLKVPLRVLDLAQLPPEIFSPGSYAEKPKSFQPFADMILQSAGLHVVTPEYNGGLPGILKYFIDMLKFPESFERRPVCFTGVAAESGARCGRSSSSRPFSVIATPTFIPNAFSCRKSTICSTLRAGSRTPN
jgi:NAD(P)H-dependent FMN reductase